jgi:hypothetical protein
MLQRALRPCLAALAACAAVVPPGAAQEVPAVQAELRLLDPRGIPLPADLVVLRDPRGERITPAPGLAGTYSFASASRKVVFEFAARELKNPGLELVLEDAPRVHVTITVDPASGKVKSIAQKGYRPRPPPERKLRSGQVGRAPALVPPANDDCAAALPISEGLTPFSTVDATTDGPAHPGACQFDGQTYEDIWFVYTPSCSGVATISTCGSASYDTDLVVYAGVSCLSPFLLDCSDDAGNCPGFTSSVTVPVTAASPYLVRVGGFSAGDEGTGTLSITCAPVAAEDECAGAVPLACGTALTVDSAAATTSPTDPEYSCAFGGALQGEGSVWLSFMASASSARIDTNATVGASDTLLALYDGSCGSLVELGCSDDDGQGLFSELCVQGLTIGNTYLVQVSSFPGSSRGDITVTLGCPGPCGLPANDECESAQLLGCGSSTTFDNSDATTSAQDPLYSCAFGSPAQGSGTLWFRFVAEASSAQLDTSASAGATDTLLAIYGGECGALVELACDDDGGLGLLSKLCLEGLTIGQSYLVQVASFDQGSLGEITLELTCPCPAPPENDECTGALDLGTLPASVAFDNTLATDDVLVPCEVFSGPFANVWFRVSGTGNTLRATTCNDGTGVDDTKISVLCGDCGAPLCVAGNDDDCSEGGPLFASSVSWCSQAGASYLITVGGFSPFTLPGAIQLDVTDSGLGCTADVPCLPQGACCLADGSCLVTTAEECAALGGLYQGDWSECVANAVADGGFEAGAFSGNWNESSTNFGTPICDSLCGFGGGTGPRSGSSWAWFGGVPLFEEGALGQALTIPVGAATLDFQLEIPVASGNGLDFLEITLDGIQVYQALESDGPFVGYRLVQVPLGAFADGGVHGLEFHAISTGDDGAGAPAFSNFFVDDVAIATPLIDCQPPPPCFALDFERDDSGAALLHGQRIDSEFDGGPEYPLTITSSVDPSGAATAAILDSDTGPAMQDPDLLIGSGNILILQNDRDLAECPPASGIYCSHNDDEDGGRIRFAFASAASPLSIALIDIDQGDPLSTVVLTDASGRRRSYSIPAGWTGDFVNDGTSGKGVLDLTTLAPQPGFASTATASEQSGFDPDAVMCIEATIGGSGALDDLVWCSSE